ncbi:MAG: peptidase [Gemmatimonadota bacterium]
MKRTRWIALLALLLLPGRAAGQQAALDYTIDLNDRADDRFHVVLAVNGLPEEGALYQFASTAPGTYQVMDIGRFVRDFEARGADGAEIPVEHVSVNQWRIEDPEDVREIRYAVAETWDTPVPEHQVYPMAGTSIEADHVLFNAHAVIGYPTGMQGTPVRVTFLYPADWTVGTALAAEGDGAYRAADYDELVDSPVLLGRLTAASTEVTGVPVSIYAYSATDKIHADQLLGAMRDMLVAAGEFLGKLPVDHYTFLYHFEGQRSSGGAWEHSYSSEYVFPEFEWSDRVGGLVTDVAAHEFFHVVTPLNIHSEIIEHFNFVTPVPSQHLWLYEGTTEWASDAMQLRAGLKTPDEYLNEVVQKLRADRQFFDPNVSLTRLSLTSYTDAGQRQYGNIYQRGAVVAGLLDIRLLELSGGERGLQELIHELTLRFGKDRPFPEDSLFDIVTEMTYPEIGDFFDRYVKEAEPLPIEAYYGKLGIHLTTDDDGKPTGFRIDPEPTPEQRRLREAWLSNP